MTVREAQFRRLEGRLPGQEGDEAMARYQTLVALLEGQYRYKAGSKLADTQGIAQPGDVLSTYWTSHLTVNHVPLDAAAVAAMTAAGFTGHSVGVKANGAPATITGAASIDA